MYSPPSIHNSQNSHFDRFFKKCEFLSKFWQAPKHVVNLHSKDPKRHKYHCGY